MRVFILDDEILKYPRKQLLDVLNKHDVVYATSKDDGIAKWGDGKYDMVLLDHDMQGYFERSEHPNTGYQFCKWLIQQPKPAHPMLVVCHSQNPVGRKNMLQILRSADYDPVEFPFSQDYVWSLQRGLTWSTPAINIYLRKTAEKR